MSEPHNAQQDQVDRNQQGIVALKYEESWLYHAGENGRQDGERDRFNNYALVGESEVLASEGNKKSD